MLLEKLALVAALLGIAALLFLSQQIEPKLIKISDVNGGRLEQNVRVRGSITSIKETDKMLLFNVEENNHSIGAIAYKNRQRVDIARGMRIEIAGRVKEFYNEVEIEVDSIKIL